MNDTDRTCSHWSPADCEGTSHCPPRCPRLVDSEGDSWVVRPPTEADRDTLVDMYDDFAPGERAQGLPPHTRSRIEDWIDDCLDQGCNFVVAGGKRVVGHALYTPTDDPEPEFAVFVHQDYQHRGVGTEVSKHVLAAASVADRGALTLVVESHNRAARSLYDTLGFETDEALSDDRAGQPVVLRLRRPLDSPESTVALRHPPLARGDIPRNASDPAASD